MSAGSTYDYAPTLAHEAKGGLVSAVEPGSPADEAGIIAGMTVLAAEGERLRDAIDWAWQASGQEAELLVSVPESLAKELGEEDAFEFEVVITRSSGQSWGITFADPLFDGMRICMNSCLFCFMRMLPSGMRKSLYLRDDDYRLSFMQGNFVTLSNIDDEDVARIVEQRLSPLHVSLHAVGENARRVLMGPRAAIGLKRLEQLLEAGIELHTQIVLVPGVNDGAELEHTLAWVLDRPQILSCGIVPLGYTRYQNRFDHSFGTISEARRVIEQVKPMQVRSREATGRGRIHLADEFYLNAGVALPTSECYDGFEQYEDGIGMVRSFIDIWEGMDAEARRLMEHAPDVTSQGGAQDASVFLLTGESFGPVLAGLVKASVFAGCVTVIAVENRFFGGNVSVAGLLCADDIIHMFSEDGHLKQAAHVYIPDVVFNADGITLDGYTIEAINEAAGYHLEVVSCEAGETFATLYEAIFGQSFVLSEE